MSMPPFDAAAAKLPTGSRPYCPPSSDSKAYQLAGILKVFSPKDIAEALNATGQWEEVLSVAGNTDPSIKEQINGLDSPTFER